MKPYGETAGRSYWRRMPMDRVIPWNGLGWQQVRMSITTWKNWKRAAKKMARQAARREIEAGT